jgi:hypothetical protein
MSIGNNVKPLAEAKAHLIKRIPWENLADDNDDMSDAQLKQSAEERRQQIIEWEKTHPNISTFNSLPWNTPNRITWEQIAPMMDISKTQKKKIVKMGTEGLSEGKDYAVVYNQNGVKCYAILTFEGSLAIANKNTGGVQGKWCTAWSKYNGFFTKYTYQGLLLFYWVTPTSKYALVSVDGEISRDFPGGRLPNGRHVGPRRMAFWSADNKDMSGNEFTNAIGVDRATVEDIVRQSYPQYYPMVKANGAKGHWCTIQDYDDELLEVPNVVGVIKSWRSNFLAQDPPDGKAGWVYYKAHKDGADSNAGDIGMETTNPTVLEDCTEIWLEPLDDWDRQIPPWNSPPPVPNRDEGPAMIHYSFASGKKVKDEEKWYSNGQEIQNPSQMTEGANLMKMLLNY